MLKLFFDLMAFVCVVSQVVRSSLSPLCRIQNCNCRHSGSVGEVRRFFSTVFGCTPVVIKSFSNRLSALKVFVPTIENGEELCIWVCFSFFHVKS